MIVTILYLKTSEDVLDHYSFVFIKELLKCVIHFASNTENVISICNSIKKTLSPSVQYVFIKIYDPSTVFSSSCYALPLCQKHESDNDSKSLVRFHFLRRQTMTPPLLLLTLFFSGFKKEKKNTTLQFM